MNKHPRRGTPHRQTATLATWFLCAAASCEGQREQAAPATVERVTQSIVVQDCPYREVVSFDPTSVCQPLPFRGTPAGVWRGSKVIDGVVLGGVSGAYCRYVWHPDSPGRNVRPPLQPFEQRTAQVDCPLVAPNAANPPTAYPPEDWLPRQQRLREHSGWVPALLTSGGLPVTVAVIDSAVHPHGSTSLDNSGHGRTMGRLIEDLACPQGQPCPVRIENHLALEEIGDARLDPANGGFFGTRAQLAAALQRALDQWVAAVRAGDQSRAVINLSLGWVPALDTNPRAISGRSLPEDVVFQVLNRASCLGALVVAAAGNGAFSSTSGPILPAGWEAQPAPGRLACGRYLDTTGPLTWPYWPFLGDWSVRDDYRPLVHAVSAVDYHDQPLAIVRPGSMPRLVAHGMGAITSDPTRPPGHTLMLTGTSVGTAIVAGAAAALWSYAPTLTAHGVADLLFSTGVGLPTVSTELCLPGACARTPVRVSLCAAASALIGSRVSCRTVGFGSGRSPDLPAPAPTPELRPQPDVLRDPGAGNLHHAGGPAHGHRLPGRRGTVGGAAAGALVPELPPVPGHRRGRRHGRDPRLAGDRQRRPLHVGGGYRARHVPGREHQVHHDPARVQWRKRPHPGRGGSGPVWRRRHVPDVGRRR